MSFDIYHGIVSGLLLVIVVTVIAFLISLVLAIAFWRRPNRSRLLWISGGLFSLVALLSAMPLIMFQCVHWPTELRAEDYRAVREQLETQVTTTSQLVSGEIAPPFSVTTTARGTFDLSDYRGSIVLINFFRTDCPPCVLEIPVLQEIWDEYGARKDFHMIAINRGESWEAITAYIEAHNLTLPIGIDSEESVYKRYAVEGIPRTYLIGRDGILLYQSVGFMQNDEYRGDEARIREVVANALGKHR